MNADIAPNASAAPAPTALRDLITGGWVSQAVYVAAKLGIADLQLANARKTRRSPIGTRARRLGQRGNGLRPVSSRAAEG